VDLSQSRSWSPLNLGQSKSKRNHIENANDLLIFAPRIKSLNTPTLSPAVSLCNMSFSDDDAVAGQQSSPKVGIALFCY
jgi:hypothetical protein